MTRLILISGSMAAGKSTVARHLVERLRARNISVALTALDEVADMARPTLPRWDWAHDIHARLVGLWVRTGIDVVVDEGSSTAGEIAQIISQVPADTPVLHVVLVGTYEEALRRVTGDRARGLSKDPRFLRQQYEHFATELPHLPRDLRLDASGSVDHQVELVLAAFEGISER